jgi:hypothetical protein
LHGIQHGCHRNTQAQVQVDLVAAEQHRRAY